MLQGFEPLDRGGVDGGVVQVVLVNCCLDKTTTTTTTTTKTSSAVDQCDNMELRKPYHLFLV